MELRHLKAFLAVAEELHFGRAANKIHIAQPALSQQIRSLEQELGTRLFERSTRTVSLTDAGEAFRPGAQRALEEIELAVRAVQHPPDEIVGVVRIGFAGASSQRVLPTLTRAVRERLPGIELQLEGQTYAVAAAERVRQGSLDFGFSRLPIPDPELIVHTFDREALVAVLPSSHRLAQDTSPLNLSELADEPFVTFPPETGSSVRNALLRATHHAGFTPRIVQEAPDSYTILGLVDAGVGVTVTVSSVLHIDSPTLVHRPLAGDDHHLDAVIVWRRRPRSRAVAAVANLVQEVLPTPIHAIRA